MAAAIRDVELSSRITTLDDIGAYPRCMVVFRWRGRVVGRAFLPVDRGCVAEAVLCAAARRLGPDPLFAWLSDTVGYDDRDSIAERRWSATVAICTRERPEDLDRALKGVTSLAGDRYEILVVDNAPQTDRSRRIVEQYPGVRYVREPTRGLDVARNRALREASGDIVAFTDDDAVPEREWLVSLLRNFDDPRVQCVTGLTLPMELETDAQELFETVSPFARGFQRRVFDGQQDNPVDVSQIGAGANMAIRRSVVDAVGRFDERLDSGTPTRSGGDHEMFVRLLSAGYQIVYDPAAVSWHRHRRTYEELVETIYGYGVGVYAMWTGLLIERREIGMLRLAWSWFRAAHLPELRRWLRRRPATATGALARAELRGCVHGPAAWFASRRLRPSGGLR